MIYSYFVYKQTYNTKSHVMPCCTHHTNNQEKNIEIVYNLPVEMLWTQKSEIVC